MKKRYYLSMLGVCPLILVFDSVYFVFHQSLEIFLALGLVHVCLFGLINFMGAYFLYQPIDRLFVLGENTKQTQARIRHLTWYSTFWIFGLGLFFNVIAQAPLFLDPAMYGDIEVFSVEKMPLTYLLANLPVTLYVQAIFPAFIIYFLINDFSFDLKAKVFTQFHMLYPAGKKKIGFTLLCVFLILVFIPALLVILELAVALNLGDQYAQFSSMDPLETVMVDRFVVLIGMVIAVVLLTRSLTKPIYSLLTEVNKVRGGDYATQAAVITEDEIGVLTQNFNDMVHELEISRHKLEAQNRTLEITVADRTQELRQKNAELEDTLNTLTEMQKQVIVQEKMATLGQLVAGLTHEINTPIGAMKSMNDTKRKAVMRLQSVLESLPRESVENDRDLKRAMAVISQADQLIDRGTERLNEIVENLKNFVRLDEAETVVADIHEGLDSVLALIAHDMLANIEVVREYGDIPPFACQARKLNQVFLNLVKNACQAMDGVGKITLVTHLKDDMVYVAIHDTGRGIRQEDLASIFDPHFTTKSAVVRARLGLSICYQIIQEHQGHIQVESEVGKGSAFTVILPMPT